MTVLLLLIVLGVLAFVARWGIRQDARRRRRRILRPLVERWESAQVEIGTALLPALRAMVPAARRAAQAFEQFSAAQRND